MQQLKKPLSVPEMDSLVSVIIPCYNAEKTINKALESILNQTYRNLEIITIDDGSTDSTAEILNAYAAKDNRIKVVRNEKNIKLIETLNKGVGLASGDYIVRMDADDISVPDRIEKEFRFLNAGGFDLVSAGIKFFRDEVKTVSKVYYPWILQDAVFLWASFFVPPVIHPAVFCKAEVLKQNKYRYSPELLHIEDYELWHRLLLKGYRFGNMDKVFLFYRCSDRSVSGTASDVQTDNFVTQVQKNIANYFKQEYDRGIITILSNRVRDGVRYAEMKSAIRVYKDLSGQYIFRNDLSKQQSRAIRSYDSHFLFATIYRAVKLSNKKDIVPFSFLFLRYAVVNMFLKSPQKTFYRLLPGR